MSEAPRRLNRGSVALDRSGRFYINRYRELATDERGQAVKRRARMALGIFPSRAQAEAHLDRYLALLEAESLQPGVAVTLRQYTAQFDRRRISVRSAQTRRTYRGTLKRYILPALGGKSLASVDVGALEDLLAAMNDRKLSLATIDATRKLAIQILRHARKAGYAAHAIKAGDVALPSQSELSCEQRYFSQAEVDAILAASHGARHALWALLAYSGVRISEALGLRFEHVDFAAGLIYVRQAARDGVLVPLKSAKSLRDVPMLPELRVALEQWAALRAPESGKLVFASRRETPLRDFDVRARWLSPLLKSLALPGAGCHAFRRYCAQHLDAIGVSPSGIQKFLGHSSLAITERYLRRASRDLNDQVRTALQRRSAAQK